MRQFAIEHEGQIVNREGQPIPSEELDHLTDVIQDELLTLTEAIDADITAALASGTIQFSLSVDATNAEEALSKGGAIIRSALHAAGVFTPDWEPLSHDELVDSEELDWRESDWRITRSSDLVEA